MKAMVLCAGFGTRLGSLTERTPKAMLPIAGEPLLAYTLRHLRAHGFDDVLVNVHFQAEQIEEYFGDGSRCGVRLTWQREEKLLGTGSSVKRAAPFFADADEALVLYGDILLDQDLGAMLAFHRTKRAAATLLVHKRAKSNSVVTLDRQGRVLAFLERPGPDAGGPEGDGWVNSGVQILGAHIRKRIPDKVPADLPVDLYIPSLTRERLFGFALTGYRCAIDSPARYQEAQAAVREGRYRVAAGPRRPAAR